ncbi:MAG: hypothetical protein L6R48_18600 [Planctomycetes bacterium]|nr:hypothetical protein [Planctomycetota bacterium]
MASSIRSSDPGRLPAGFAAVDTIDTNAMGRRLRARKDGRAMRLWLPSSEVLEVPHFLQNLEQRVRVAGAVRHPGLVLPSQYLAAERALVSADAPDHEPLNALIARQGCLAPSPALAIARQVATALDEAAKQGIHHGWLRTEAVLVDRAGRALVDDLAPAKPLRWLAERQPRDQHLVIAPERLDGTSPDRSGDIFGIGALLLAMLTDSGPYGAGAGAGAMGRYMRPPVLSQLRGDLPRVVDQLVQRLLDPDPGMRPTTWAEVIEDIDAVIAGQEPGSSRRRQRTPAPPQAAAAPPPPIRFPTPAPGSMGAGPVPAARRRQRNSGGPLVIILVVAAVLVVAVVALVAMGGRSKGPEIPVDQGEKAPVPVVSADRTAEIRSQFDKKKAEEEARKAAAMKRLERIKEIDNLLVGERFQAALDAATQLDGEARSALEERIRSGRERRRGELEAQLPGLATVDEAAQVLAPALTTWGTPGDREWAQGLLAAARTRIAAAEEARRKAAGPKLPPIPAVPLRALVRADQAADRALAVGRKPEAAELPADQLRALALKQSLWARRDRLVGKALAAKVRLRITHPTTRELCDVAKADGRFLDLAAANGSTSSVGWATFPGATLARLFADCLNASGITADDTAVAVASMLVVGDPTLARATIRRAKDLAPEVRADLDLLGVAGQRRALQPRCEAAESALRADQAGPIEELAAELGKAEWKDLPGTAEERAWCEAAHETVRLRTAAAAAAATAAPAQ